LGWLQKKKKKKKTSTYILGCFSVSETNYPDAFLLRETQRLWGRIRRYCQITSRKEVGRHQLCRYMPNFNFRHRNPYRAQRRTKDTRSVIVTVTNTFGNRKMCQRVWNYARLLTAVLLVSTAVRIVLFVSLCPSFSFRSSLLPPFFV
jgi:hypothetical protein